MYVRMYVYGCIIYICVYIYNPRIQGLIAQMSIPRMGLKYKPYQENSDPKSLPRTRPALIVIAFPTPALSPKSHLQPRVPTFSRNYINKPQY